MPLRQLLSCPVRFSRVGCGTSNRTDAAPVDLDRTIIFDWGRRGSGRVRTRWHQSGLVLGSAGASLSSSGRGGLFIGALVKSRLGGSRLAAPGLRRVL